MKVVFMGTPQFAVPALAALLASTHTVVAVYSQPPRPAGRGMKLTESPVHQHASQRGIPVLTPESLKPAEVQQQFAAHGADVAVVAAYGLLLPQAVLDAPKHGCINIHPSDLPRWRGAAPMQRTLMAGDATAACCIMQMEAGLDTGPVLLRESFAISPTMNAGELHDAMTTMGAKLAVQALDRFSSLTPVAQSDVGVTYAAKITKADQGINWSQPAVALLNQIRALSPSPGAMTQLNGETIKIYAAVVEAGDSSKPAGMVLDHNLLMNAGGGSGLRLLELQRAGKNRQKATEFLKGFTIIPGNTAETLVQAG